MPPPNPSARPPEPAVAGRRIPTATYRWQFNREFTFAHAQEAAGYLRELGISDVYASPLFRAGPQSTHGYDICGFDAFSPQLGGTAEFERLAGRLRELGLGLLLDMVPNHMGADQSNRWWADVLEQGRASPFAAWFDIDWQPLNADLRDQVLLPTLEDHYASVLESGKLQLVFEGGGFSIAYYDRRFPVAGESYAPLLKEVLGRLQAGGNPGEAVENLAVLLQTLGPKEGRAAERWEFAKVKEQLEQWRATSAGFRQGVEQVLKDYNGHPGAPRSFDQLHRLLQAQHYRLAYWRVGPEEINYRRFFDITELVSLRMELPEVFRACHELVFQLVHKGQVTGLRIDHPDGLWDPRKYSAWLQEAASSEFRLQAASGANLQSSGSPPEPAKAGTPNLAAGTAPAGQRPPRPLYVVAEKILTGDEALPSDWPVDGTTGYDFLNRVNGLFVNRDHREAFDRIYREFTGCELDFPAIVFRSKKRILETAFPGDLNALAHRLKRLAGSTRCGLDLTFRQLHAGLAEVIAAFPVYRTYLTETTTEPSPQEKEYIEQAVREARARSPKLDPAVFDFIRHLLLLRLPEDLDEAGRSHAREFVIRFQQLTGPVMAKGLEDTAFYNYNRLVSLNDVGGNPDQFGISVEEFHLHNAGKARCWPHALLATATHDTKRGEDVRARLNVLSEMPDEWRQAVGRWRRLNADKKNVVDGQPAPHPNDEYLLYQTLVGAWPVARASLPAGSGGIPALHEFRDRIAAYMLKAIKEAKARTSWTDPNPAYEAATQNFVHALLEPRADNLFLQDFLSFQHRVAFFGRFNSLAQVLLKMTAPGVPDFYQGTELWDFNLVDPDNRRPVDYALRRRLLAELKEQSQRNTADLSGLLRRWLEADDLGRLKLYLIYRTLEFRNRHAGLFADGAYVPLTITGARRDHLCAFARQAGDQVAVVAAPRLVVGLAGGDEQAPLGEKIWQDTRLHLPKGRYRDWFTGAIIPATEREGGWGLPAGQALASVPAALLERVD